MIRNIGAGGGGWKPAGSGLIRRTRRDLLKLEQFEQSAVAGARAAFVCHEHDGASFRPVPLVVPNCVDMPEERIARTEARNRVVMLGNFSADGSPNTDGLIWFLDEIWPKVRQASPEAQFQVVGPVGQRARRAVEQAAAATSAGFVRDLGQAFAEASLSIAPIRYGTGTRIKILESFAQGCPVVSTTAGREGIEAQDGHDLLVSDIPAHFCRTMFQVVERPRLSAAYRGSGPPGGRHALQRSRPTPRTRRDARRITGKVPQSQSKHDLTALAPVLLIGDLLPSPTPVIPLA